jgi:2-oxoglutarate-Fe(II)-dependent oxygenase superfamily protein
MFALARELLGAPVVQRAGWCGPGVHIFPAGLEVADTGGEVHFDTEGLGEEELRVRRRALSFVLMLQAPEKGGGLRLWDALYDGDDHPSPPPPAVANLTIQYEPGELVVLDSYRLHQIQPFGGSVDRVSATMHLVDTGEAWEAWF